MMKLLLDEQLPKSLAKEFPTTVEVHTVQSQGWAGVTNGALLDHADGNGFTALVSADKNIASQHNEKQLVVPVVVL
jgi:predicted nuclease of predicted toxin-antitoxin system